VGLVCVRGHQIRVLDLPDLLGIARESFPTLLFVSFLENLNSFSVTFLESQITEILVISATNFAMPRIKLPADAMARIQDESYQNMFNTLAHDHEVEIHAMFKEIVPWRKCGLRKDHPDYEKISEECLQEALAAGKTISPAYYVMSLIREDNAQLRQGRAAESTEKAYSDNGYRRAEVYDARGESSKSWALYQAGWRFIESDPDLSVFCFKHLLVLSNGKLPYLFWRDADDRMISRLQIALGKVASSFYDQMCCARRENNRAEESRLKGNYCVLRQAGDRFFRY
jgi:hypothetical protein